MKIFTPLFFLLVLILSLPLWAEEGKNKSDHAKEFLDTKFIQLDQLNIPNELETISKQITQNAIDVIILASGHSVIYSQKMEEGYTEKFKHFYGLTITISPVKSQSDIFSLNLKYYNWTTIRFDKNLRKNISKYNVLNELRFSLYELFKGKQFINENKEALEQESYERITSIRKTIEEEKLLKKNPQPVRAQPTQSAQQSIEEKQEIERFKREKRELLKKVNENATKPQENELSSSSPSSENLTLEDEASTTQPFNKQPPSSTGAQSRNKKSSKNVQKSTPESSTASLEQNPISSKPSYPSGSRFHLITGLSSQTIQTQYIIPSSTNTTFLNAGLNYLSKPPTKWPYAYRFSVGLGYPIKKEDYPLPITKDLSADIGPYRLFSFLSFGPGVAYQSLNFVNLPERGKNLQLISNSIVSSYLFLTSDFSIYEIQTQLSLNSSQSLISKNSYNQQVEISQTQIGLHLEKLNHGIRFNYLSGKISGLYSGSFKNISFFYTYLFSSTLM